MALLAAAVVLMVVYGGTGGVAGLRWGGGWRTAPPATPARGGGDRPRGLFRPGNPRQRKCL